MPDCSGVVNTAESNGSQDGSGDEPLGKRFFPCWHSVAASTTSTLTVSTSPQTGLASKCLSASAVVSAPTSTVNVFSPVKLDKLPDSKTSPAAANSVGTVTNCRYDVCDNDVDEDDDDEDDDDDDESVSDESSSASNQKDGGKYCECWRCEFFGHADVRFCYVSLVAEDELDFTCCHFSLPLLFFHHPTVSVQALCV